MFLPDIVAWSAAAEQASPSGSMSPISVKPPLPSGDGVVVPRPTGLVRRVDAVGLAGDQVDGARGGRAEVRRPRVVVERVVLGVAPARAQRVAVEVRHDEARRVGAAGAVASAAAGGRRVPGELAGRGPSSRCRRPAAPACSCGSGPRSPPASGRGGTGSIALGAVGRVGGRRVRGQEVDAGDRREAVRRVERRR